jgi:ABC-2 type transport system ATP-binding protein
MTAVRITGIRHTYPGKRKTGAVEVLRGIDLTVEKGRIFGFLGPNGSGKTTLFKILATLFPPSSGSAEILGIDIVKNSHEIRRRIGIVFQNPSLDGKLTVEENLVHQAHLYGLSGAPMQKRIDFRLEQFGLSDRRHQFVETLSGGLKRRVELAKGLLHNPEVLILDEPSTGLDPAARRSLWSALATLRSDDGVTILVTTHLIAEAEQCDRLAIIDRGRVVGEGSPDELKSEIGGDVITVSTPSPTEFAEKYFQKFNEQPMIVNGKIRVEKPSGHRFIPEIVEAWPALVQGVSYGKPTLDDVFVHKTGHSLAAEAEEKI